MSESLTTPTMSNETLLSYRTPTIGLGDTTYFGGGAATKLFDTQMMNNAVGREDAYNLGLNLSGLGDTNWLSGLSGGDIMGGLGAATNAYLGFKQLGLAEDTFDFNKKMAEANYAATADQVNYQREGQQKRDASSYAARTKAGDQGLTAPTYTPIATKV